MYFKKKLFVGMMMFSVILLLAACGGKDASHKEIQQDGQPDFEQDGQPENPGDFTLFSEGLKGYKVWFTASNYLERNSSVRTVYVFDGDELTRYENGIELKIEDMNDMSDGEIVELAKSQARNVIKGKYVVNIILDELGQSTKEVEVFIENGIQKSILEVETIAAEGYEGVEVFEKYESMEAYEEAIKNGEHPDNVEIVGDDYITTSDFKSSIVEVIPWAVDQQIFDTKYAGISTVSRNNDEGLYTRVDEDFFGFTPDTPDDKGKDVTVEGK